MSLLNYDVLRTAKAALDEGLIDQCDYDAVKTSFLKAQQIKVRLCCCYSSLLFYWAVILRWTVRSKSTVPTKAGLDAGFIPEAEFANIKRAFLESLDIVTTANDVHVQNHVTPGPQVSCEPSCLLSTTGYDFYLCLDSSSLCC